MQIRCPSCHRPLEIPDSDIGGRGEVLLGNLSCVECPDCGLVEMALAYADTRSMPHPPPTSQPRRVAHFDLIKLVGEGGYGQVWKARDRNLDRDVALKLPLIHGAEADNLKYEARAAANLQHPNIVAIHEVGEFQGQVYITSDFIDGLNLRELIRSRRPSQKRTIELLCSIARALQYAHDRGIVHRDVKPANVLVDAEGRPHVTDFGLAKRLQADVTITEEGDVVGTARYMSPEQAAGRTRQTDHRADIYALGVMLYEMLTGTFPYTGSIEAILYQKVHDDPPSPRTRAPKLDKDLETICLRALERDLDKRYSSALEFARELERYSAGEPILSRPISRLERGWRWCKRRPDVAGLLAGLFLALTFGLLVSGTFWLRAEANYQQSEVNREIAEAQADSLRRSLYRARMNQAAIQFAAGDYAGLRQNLNEIEADPLMAPLIGFEADYFAAQATPLRPIANHGGLLTGVAISPDGSLCASTGLDQQQVIRVWDVQSGRLVRELAVADVPVDAIAFSPAGGRLASGSRDGVVRLWNPRQDAIAVAEATAGGQVRKVRFSPDGLWLVACGRTGGLRVFHGDDLAPADHFPGGESIEDVQFTPESRSLVAAVNQGQLRIWELGNDQPQPPMSVPVGIRSLAISEDGVEVAAGTYTSQLWRCWLDGSREPETIDVDWGRIDRVEFLLGSRTLIVSASDGQLHWFDLAQSRELRQVRTHEFGVGRVSRSARGNALVIGRDDGEISLIQIDDRSQAEILWHEAPVRDVAWLPGGAELLTLDNEGRLTRWRMADGASESIDIADVTRPWALAVDPDGTHVAIAGDSPVVLLCDPRTLTPQHRLAVKSRGVTHVRFSPSSRLLAICGDDGAVSVFQTGEWTRPVVEVASPGSSLTAIAVADAAPHLALAWVDGRVALLDAATDAAPRDLPLGDLRCTALSLCLENQLVLGSETGELVYWNLSSGNVSRRLKGHSGRIRVICPLPGGDRLLTAGYDRSPRLWDPLSGELITRFRGESGQIFAVAPAPDGRSLACAAITGDVRILRAPARMKPLALTD